eukprot:286620-Pelagomonas_calceolata.AAC.8
MIKELGSDQIYKMYQIWARRALQPMGIYLQNMAMSIRGIAWPLRLSVSAAVMFHPGKANMCCFLAFLALLLCPFYAWQWRPNQAKAYAQMSFSLRCTHVLEPWAQRPACAAPGCL